MIQWNAFCIVLQMQITWQSMFFSVFFSFFYIFWKKHSSSPLVSESNRIPLAELYILTLGVERLPISSSRAVMTCVRTLLHWKSILNGCQIHSTPALRRTRNGGERLWYSCFFFYLLLVFFIIFSKGLWEKHKHTLVKLELHTLMAATSTQVTSRHERQWQKLSATWTLW